MKAPHIFRISSRILPRILLRIFGGVFVLPSVGIGDQKKSTKNPCHSSMQNSQVKSKKKPLLFWRAGKVTFWPPEGLVFQGETGCVCVYILNPPRQVCYNPPPPLSYAPHPWKGMLRGGKSLQGQRPWGPQKSQTESFLGVVDFCGCHRKNLNSSKNDNNNDHDNA